MDEIASSRTKQDREVKAAPRFLFQAHTGTKTKHYIYTKCTIYIGRPEPGGGHNLREKKLN